MDELLQPGRNQIWHSIQSRMSLRPTRSATLLSRFFFRGIYFPQKGTWQWLKLIAQNRSSVWRIVKDSYTQWNGTSDRRQVRDFEHGVQNATLVAQPEREVAAD